MISQQVSRITKKSDKFTKYLLPRFFCVDINEGPAKRQERKLRNWRELPDRGPKSFLGLWDRSTRGGPKARTDSSFGRTDLGEKPDLSLANMKEHWLALEAKVERENQKFIPARMEILGSDLALAQFVLHRGGKIKFRGDDEWVEMNEKTMAEIPKAFDPRFVVSAVDCTGMNLYYEGLLTFENLTRIKWASFRGNQVFDAWSLDRIVGQLPSLEYLDISECPKLKEGGLEALYKLFYLKTLIVTNYEKSAAFELTCLMLEDCNPNLECKILQAGEKLTEKAEADAN